MLRWNRREGQPTARTVTSEDRGRFNMRKFVIAAVAAVLALSGCMSDAGQTVSVEKLQLSPAELAQVQQAVKNNMKDPGSAQFGPYVAFIATMKNGETHRVVCGYVNGKNSFGGYVGQQPFMAAGAVTAAGATYLAAGPDDLYNVVCRQKYGVSI